MNRRSIFSLLTSVVVASALDFGYLSKVLRRKWRFETEVRFVQMKPWKDMNAYEGWYAFLQQRPIGVSNGDPSIIHQSKQLTLMTPHGGSREQIELAAAQAILARQYELGELV